MSRTEIPSISIRPGSIALYNTIDYDTPRIVKTQSLRNLDDNRHYGTLSHSARKRMRKAVINLIYITKFRHERAKDKRTKNSKHKLTFATLTLPAEQRHTDKELRTFALNQLLTELRKEYKVVFYLWKAERQKNGNLHYHLLFDRYIPHTDLRERWNRILNKGKVKGCKTKFDYVDRYQQRMKKLYKNGFVYIPEWQNSYEKQRKNYYAQMKLPEAERWSNPNSTDIQSVKKMRNINAYITKYITKDITDTEKVQELKKEIQTLITRRDELHTDPFFKHDRTIRKQYENTVELLERKQKQFAELLEDLKTKTLVEGRIWFQSRELSAIEDAKDLEADYYEELETLFNYLLEKEQWLGEKTIINYDYASVWLVQVEELRQLGLMKLFNLFNNNFLNQIKEHL